MISSAQGCLWYWFTIVATLVLDWVELVLLVCCMLLWTGASGTGVIGVTAAD